MKSCLFKEITTFTNIWLFKFKLGDIDFILNLISDIGIVLLFMVKNKLVYSLYDVYGGFDSPVMCFLDYLVYWNDTLDVVKMQSIILSENSGIGGTGFNNRTEFLQGEHLRCLSNRRR